MKNENLSCVPKVRFPGFQDPWKVVYGNDIFATVSEKNGGAELSLLALSQELGAIPRSMIDYHVLVSEVSKANYKVVRAGDFIISLRSFQGGIEYSCYDGLCSPAYIVLRNRVPISHLFYKYFFKTTGLISALNRNLEGIRDGKMVSYKQFSEIRIPYPSLDEQHKIASCLSSIDDVIKETEEKVESLKKHKLGLMQKMFPNRENVKKKVICGNKNDVPEWTFHKIGDISTSFSGGTPKTSNPEFYGGQIPFIRSSEIHSEKTVLFLTEDGLRNSSAKMVSKGDILLAMYGANSGDIAVSKMDGSINQAILCLRVNCDKMFFVHFFTFIKQQILSSMLQGGQGNLSADIIKNIVIPLCSPSGQKHIASCLSSIDDIITAYKEKLTLLKLHKKGLLQQLFPQMNFNQ